MVLVEVAVVGVQIGMRSFRTVCLDSHHGTTWCGVVTVRVQPAMAQHGPQRARSAARSRLVAVRWLPLAPIGVPAASSSTAVSSLSQPNRRSVSGRRVIGSPGVWSRPGSAPGRPSSASTVHMTVSAAGAGVPLPASCSLLSRSSWVSASWRRAASGANRGRLACRSWSVMVRVNSSSQASCPSGPSAGAG